VQHTLLVVPNSPSLPSPPLPSPSTRSKRKALRSWTFIEEESSHLVEVFDSSVPLHYRVFVDGAEISVGAHGGDSKHKPMVGSAGRKNHRANSEGLGGFRGRRIFFPVGHHSAELELRFPTLLGPPVFVLQVDGRTVEPVPSQSLQRLLNTNTPSTPSRPGAGAGAEGDAVTGSTSSWRGLEAGQWPSAALSGAEGRGERERSYSAPSSMKSSAYNSPEKHRT
jgi:hypothetical protein